MEKEQPIKIQLNSEAAIRSLIDGDPELQLEIKRKITCAIAEGYEKINKQVIERSSYALTKLVSEQVMNDITEPSRPAWNSTRYIKPEIRTMINDHINSRIEYIVFETIHKTMDAQVEEMKKMIQKRIDDMATDITKRITNKAFENTVEQEVIRRISSIHKALDKGT